MGLPSESCRLVVDSTMLDNDEEEGNPINAEVVEISSAVSTAQIVANLTWTDRFYDHEPNIVAVFDLDNDAILNYQTRMTIFWTLCSLAMMILVVLNEAIDMIPFSMIFSIFAILFSIVAVKAGNRANAARVSRNGGGVHLAITTVSVRYDQVDPMISTEISLQDITSCSYEMRKDWSFCTPGATLNLVHLQISGSMTPNVYVGVVDPKNFVKVIMMLKNEQGTRSGVNIV